MRKVFITSIVLLLTTASRSENIAQTGVGGTVHVSTHEPEHHGSDQKSHSSGQTNPDAIASARYQALPSPETLSGKQDTPYSFSYSVNDSRTGDVHSQQESRDSNGVVTGQYQLIEADGTLRIVEYTAGAFGFIPKVRRIPHYAPPPPLPPYPALPSQGSAAAPSHAVPVNQGRSAVHQSPTHPVPALQPTTHLATGPHIPTVASRAPVPHQPTPLSHRPAPVPTPTPYRPTQAPQPRYSTTISHLPSFPTPSPSRPTLGHQRPAPVKPSPRSPATTPPHTDDEEPIISY